MTMLNKLYWLCCCRMFYLRPKRSKLWLIMHKQVHAHENFKIKKGRSLYHARQNHLHLYPPQNHIYVNHVIRIFFRHCKYYHSNNNNLIKKANKNANLAYKSKKKHICSTPLVKIIYIIPISHYFLYFNIFLPIISFLWLIYL